MRSFTLNPIPAWLAPAALAPAALALCSLGGCASSAEAPADLPQETSVKPGINDSFLDPDLSVQEYVGRFEGESREVFANRKALADAIGLEPGQAIVDVGAGTGPFMELFANAVGPEGTVYAVDIAPNFVTHLARRAKKGGHTQVIAQQCGENSVGLPADSVDAAFICDVYHHFEFPRSTMASLHSALREDGQVVIVDFERIPGVSREWTLNHVRAGKQEVITELDRFGFDLVEEIKLDRLEENYVLRFRKR